MKTKEYGHLSSVQKILGCTFYKIVFMTLDTYHGQNFAEPYRQSIYQSAPFTVKSISMVPC